MTPATIIQLTAGQMTAIVLSIISGAFVLFTAVVGGVWWLGRDLQRIDGSINRLRDDMENSFSYMKIGINSLMTILRSRDGISEDERSMLAQHFGFRVVAAGNPISPEEAARINSYLDMVIAKKDLTNEESDDFKNLAEKFVADPEVQKKYDNDKLGILLALAKEIWASKTLQK